MEKINAAVITGLKLMTSDEGRLAATLVLEEGWNVEALLNLHLLLFLRALLVPSFTLSLCIRQ